MATIFDFMEVLNDFHKKSYYDHLERDKDKRNELIDRLSDEDAKYLLKQYLSNIHGDPEFDFNISLK